jgi:murein L,D-transpeptidase YafK
MRKQVFSLLGVFLFSSFTNSVDFKSGQLVYGSADSLYVEKAGERQSEVVKNNVNLASLTSVQMGYGRVRTAFNERIDGILRQLDSNNIRINEMEILLQTFKAEQEIELWAKNKSDSVYKYIKSYPFCSVSGELGPKRRQGDKQTPEGFYYIDEFNPTSNYYLSLEVSYPNQSDLILGNRANPGGLIYIHGSCVTIGCIPITDDLIKELYIYALEAKSNGQENIPVYMFPENLTDENFKELETEYAGRESLLKFWANLKEGYDKFQKNPKELSFTVDSRGIYIFE